MYISHNKTDAYKRILYYTRLICNFFSNNREDNVVFAKQCQDLFFQFSAKPIIKSKWMAA